MRFKKIKIKNIRSYEDQEIEFPEGSLLLSGNVGAGKTSILLAIEYALFGLQPGQKGTALLRNTGSSGEVSLEFEVGGKNAIIERRLKRTLKGVSNEYASITINGERTESSITEIKFKIMELLGYPSEFVKKNNVLYRYTVHTPQEQMKQIILEDSETRLNILRHIFGIDKYKQIKDNLSLLIIKLKGDIKMLQGEIQTLDKDKENLEFRKSTIGILEEKIGSQEKLLSEKIMTRREIEIGIKELEQKIEEKRGFEREVEKTQIMVLTKNEILSSIGKEEQELRKVIIKTEERFSEPTFQSLLEEIKHYKIKSENLNIKFVEFASRAGSFEKDRIDILAKKERIFRIDMCPTCLQDVSENHKHNILNETERKLSEIKRDSEQLEEKKKEIFLEIEKNKGYISGLEDKKLKMEVLKSKQDQIESALNKLKELEKKIQILQSDKVLLEAHIVSMKEKILEYSPLSIKFKNKEQELKQAFLEEKNTEISLAELKKELELSRNEVSILEQAIKRKEESKVRFYELNELIGWLSTQFLNLIDLTERNVLLKLREEFSALFRKWFLMLIPDESLESQIDDNFTPIIMQGESEMDYSFLSGGERTAVALAYRLALNQTINSMLSRIKTRGIIILDEPTDGFSEEQIDKIRDILEELNAEQLIIVSHEQKVEGFVDNVLRVVKDGDKSSIETVNNQKI